jgi:outer membrane protein assembly factor BamE
MVQRHRPAPVFRPRLPGLALLAVLLIALPTSGCVYRMTVQQGNFLDARQVVQVKEGMTRAQVRFLLGTPMLPDAFDRDRWDYLYYLKVGRLQKAEEQRLTIYFTDEKVSRIENVGAPTEVPTTEPPATEAPAASATPAAATP